MQVPTRKPGKYTNNKVDPHMTEEKYEAFKKTLKELRVEHPRLVKEMQVQAEDGDFSENEGYQLLKRKVRALNNRILRIENILKQAVIIKPQAGSQVVQLGHTVTVERDGKQKSYQILGSSETNPARGIISQNSPIGSALLGCRVGDVVKIEIRGQGVDYRIVKVE